MNPLMKSSGSIFLQDEVSHIEVWELNKLFDALEYKYYNLERKGEKNIYTFKRDRLLLLMMWNTGARISDVLSFTAEDIDFGSRTLTFNVQKRGYKVHTISLDKQIIIELSEYLRTTRIKGYLFKNVNTSNPIKRQYVNKLLKQLSEIAGIRKITPHMIRHGLAIYLQRKGVQLEFISYRLAHSNTYTTAQYYARINPDMERENIPDVMGELYEDKRF